MPTFVRTYTKVYSTPFYANSLAEAEHFAKAATLDDKGCVLIAVRTSEEHQAAVARGEVG